MTAARHRLGFLIVIILFSALILSSSVFASEDLAYAAASGSWDDYTQTFTLENPSLPNSETNPYIIDTPEKLAKLSHTLNSGEASYSGVFFRQTADLDMSAHYFTPIGHGGRTFTGTYDGNGRAIQGLFIDVASSEAGLFGRITTSGAAASSGVIKNVSILSGEIKATGSYVGSIAGYILNGRIENCNNSAKVSAVNAADASYYNAGGIVGASDNADIRNCYNHGIVEATGGYTNVGGIAGRFSTQDNPILVTLDTAYNAAPVSGGTNVGGIVGQNYGTVQNAYNVATVAGSNVAGGVVGQNNGIVSKVYNIGEVTGSAGKIGMVAGQHLRGNLSDCVFLNKTYDRDITVPGAGEVTQGQGTSYGMDYIDLTGTVPRLNSAGWSFLPREAAVGYTPYLTVFGAGSADYGMLSLFGQSGMSGGWGSNTNPFGINSAKQLDIVIRNNLANGETYAGKYFALDKDITLGSFQPIGAEEMPFEGGLDGNDHSFNGVVISGSLELTGIFAYLKNSTIKNLSVNATVTSINANGVAGILAGKAENLTIDKVIVEGTVVSGGAAAGGFFGETPDSVTFTDCVSNADIYGALISGGFIGKANFAAFTSCIYDGSVSEVEIAGGFVGKVLAGSIIEDSISVGEITAADYAGGFAGWSNDMQILRSFTNNSRIDADLTGGAVGRLDGTGELTVFYSVSKLYGNTAGGFFGSVDSSPTISYTYFSGRFFSDISDAIAAIGVITPASVTETYYNTDFAETSVSGVQAKTSIELTQLTIADFIATASGSYYGYFPAIDTLYDSEYTLPGIRYDYFKQGSGVAYDPYQIASEAHLVNMQRFIQSDYENYKNKSYALAQDIVLENEFFPIASYDFPFEGSFDGRYCTIYGLVINGGDYAALFASTAEGAEITRVNLMPYEVSLGNFRGSVTGVNYVAGLVAFSEGKISKSSNRLTVTGVDYVGGITGRYDTSLGANPLPINECFNTGKVTGVHYVGGIAGFASGINNCFNAGQILGVEVTGGIVGSLKGTVINSYNSGELRLHPSYSVGEYFGGIAGQAAALAANLASVNLCYVIGSAVLDGITGFGALVGNNLNTNNIAVSSSYYNTDILPGVSIIGAGGTTNYFNTYGRTTVQMAGTGALSAGNMDGLYQGYIVSGGKGDVADYSPQLEVFMNIIISAPNNTAAETFIKSYSMQSVMLRLYGIDPSNIAEWGSAANPYLLESFDHLNTLRSQVNNGYDYVGKTFRITSDITVLSGFAPIGIYSDNALVRKAFLGTLDGNGHAIYDLSINEISSGYSAGLVGYLGIGGIIKNLIIESGSIQGASYVGSFAGYSEGTIINCLSRATVTGSASVGGIVGRLASIGASLRQIQNCVYQGALTGESAATRGGIVGSKSGTAIVYNSWYVTEDSSLRHNSYGSALLVDINGAVYAEVNPYAPENEIVVFNALPHAGFGFVFKDTLNREILFSVSSGSVRMPMYATNGSSGGTQYAGGEGTIWRAHFTKQVTLGTVLNGTATGGGYYYQNETVTVSVRPNMGYRLKLEGDYNYSSTDGENISVSWKMGDSAFTFNAECIIFGHEEGEITYGDNQSVITNVAGGIVSSPLIVFDYDGTTKEFEINITGAGVTLDWRTEIYRLGSTTESVSEAKNANTYRFMIRLWQEWKGASVVVGRKYFDFKIDPRQLTLDIEAIMAEENYYTKQYDKDASDTITFPIGFVTNLVSGDVIGLTATRTFFDGETPSADVAEEKGLRFMNFVITGIAAGNYLAPADISELSGVPLTGEIIKRRATVIVSHFELTKEYDGSAPTVSVTTIEGEMQGDGLMVSRYGFVLVDSEDNPIPDDGSWSVGRYLITIDSMEGNSENYDISIELAYYLITPRVITEIEYTGVDGLRYTGRNYADGEEGGIIAYFPKANGGKERAQLVFYKNDIETTECINAGEYVAVVVITDPNYTIDEEKSITFTIAKITPSPALSIDPIPDVDFSVTDIDIIVNNAMGGGIVYEILTGKAQVSDGKITPLAAGTITLRVYEKETENYYKRYSETISFKVAKSVLKAQLGEYSMIYGDSPVIEITYEGYVRGENGDKSKIDNLFEPTAIAPLVLDVKAGGYTVTLKDDGYADGYYIDVSEAIGTLLVLPRPVTVEADAKHKIFGENDPVFTYTASEGTFVGTLSRADGETVGSYEINQGTLTQENNPNYEITFIPAYLTVEKRDLYVSIPSVTKVYGNADPVFTFMIDGDTASIVTGTITRDAGENAGTYALRESSVTAGENYRVVILPSKRGSLTILKATPALIGVPVASTIVYGDTLSESIITGTASVAGSFRWVYPQTLPTVHNSGITEYAASFVPTDTSNYNTVSFNLTLEVQRRAITVAFIGETSHIYDGTDKRTLQAEARNTVGNDEVEVTLTYSAPFLVNVGTYTVTAAVNDANYRLSNEVVPLEIKIFKALVTVTAEDQEIIDGEEIVPNLTYSGFKGNDNELNLTKPVKVNITNRTQGRATMVPYGAEAQNYDFRYVSGVVTIHPKEIKTDEITVSGNGLKAGTEITVTGVEQKSASFRQMADYVDKQLKDSDFSEFILNSYTAVNFSVQPTGKLTYKVAMELGEDEVLVAVRTDGSVVVITDFAYEDGIVTFEATGIKGVGSAREKSLIDKYLPYWPYAAAALGVAAALGIIIPVAVSNARAKKRRTPVYKD